MNEEQFNRLSQKIEDNQLEIIRNNELLTQLIVETYEQTDSLDEIKRDLRILLDKTMFPITSVLEPRRAIKQKLINYLDWMINEIVQPGESADFLENKYIKNRRGVLVSMKKHWNADDVMIEN